MAERPAQRLGTRLTLLVAFGLLVISTGSVAFAVHLEHQALTDEFQREGRAIAKTVAAMSLEPMISADVTILETHMRELANLQARVLHVAIRGPKGKMLAQSRSNVEKTDHEANFSAPIIIAAKGIPAEQLGTVHVRYDMSFVTRLGKRVLLGASSGVVLSLILLSAFVWFVVRRSVIIPIATLDDQVATLSTGALDQAIGSTERDDELGRLARSVEGLRQGLRQSLEGLEQRRRELEILNAELRKEKDAFVRFVPQPFAKLLGRAKASDIQLGDNQQQYAAVLFSDIRGFTSLAEELGPGPTLQLLNRYLEEMVDPVRKNNGVVDKFLGDAIMALFPAGNVTGSPPAQSPTQADNALRAAVAMRHALRKFNQDEATRGVRPLQTGLALHWGHVVLGTIGTQQRLDTTVIGDPVNVAARLEGLSRHFGSEILITGEFVAALSTPNNHQLRLVARSVLRGRHADTTVYEVLDSLEPAQLKLRLSSRHLLEEGIGALEDERFVDATRCFLAGHEIDKDDATFAYYLDTAERERRLTTMPSGLTI